jgi:exonuclease SbcC
MGDQFRLNLTSMRDVDKVVGELENQISALSQVDANRLRYTQVLTQLAARLEGIEMSRSEWERSGAPRLEEITADMEQETYAAGARARLKEIDAELLAIGYDAATHDAVRRTEAQSRTAETELRELEKAQATLAPLVREISDIEGQLRGVIVELENIQHEYTQSAKSLASAEAEAPDLETAEVELLNLQEQENRQRLEVGAARQKVHVLDDLKVRRNNLEGQREAQARLVGQYKQLERAFGKDGIPALLIEQALPQIELRANNVLERLSGGKMNVRFETQSAFKDKKRDDLRETLDIKISDNVGTRDYELFSGGEAFRVNFAIRLALSEVLAQRAGARLQTLVIDEGFGSQDAEGRQRLVEAINLVKQDASTYHHIDELKEAFPVRIGWKRLIGE